METIIGGNLLKFEFPNRDQMQEAAKHLLVCHPHHFCVTPDDRNSLIISPMALECLRPMLAKKK